MSKSEHIPLEEVAKHNNAKSLWIVIDNSVYDVTAFLNEHPGGEDALLDYAGKDGTVAFEEVGHSGDARALMKKYKIGEIKSGKKCCCIGECKKYLPYAVGVLAAGILLCCIIKRFR